MSSADSPANIGQVSNNHYLVNDSNPPKRRRRTKLACQACRDRKIRCDGGTPVCDTCRRKNIDLRLCVYPSTDSHLHLSQHVQRRQTQNNFAELGSQSDYRPRNNVSSTIFRSSNGASVASPVRVPSTPSQEQHEGNLREQARRVLEDTSSWAGENIPGVVGSANSNESVDNVYDVLHQPSSAENDSMSAPPPLYETSQSIDLTQSTRLSSANVGHCLADLSLPPKSLMDRLFRIYWNDIHPLSPLFHEQKFMKHYDLFWSEGPKIGQQPTSSPLDPKLTSSDKILYATINLILALVQQRTPSQQRKTHQATDDIFYNRADRFLTPELMELESLGLVQALVLKAAYLREADMTNRSWMAVGTAIRAAQAIGLQLEHASGSQAEREERRRVWYSCVIMDRVQSMTFGRPEMISGPLNPPHPMAIDDEFISTEPGPGPDAVQPNNIPSRMTYFVSTIRLSDIRSRIRQYFFARKLHEDCSVAKQYGAIIGFDADIGRWYEQVPSYLRVPGVDPKSANEACFVRQSMYLKCQFLQIRIFLFRPLILELARNRPARGLTFLQNLLAQGCVETCIRAAQEFVTTIEPNIGTNLLPPGWYITSYYLYSAGAAVATVLLNPALQELCKGISSQELQETWTHCLNCFAKYDQLGIRFAKKCISGLKTMFAEDQGPAAANMQRNQRMSPHPGHAARQILDDHVSPVATTTDNHIAAHSEDVSAIVHQENLVYWWMNEDFHCLPDWDKNNEFAPAVEGNNDIWRDLDQEFQEYNL